MLLNKSIQIVNFTIPILIFYVCRSSPLFPFYFSGISNILHKKNILT